MHLRGRITIRHLLLILHRRILLLWWSWYISSGRLPHLWCRCRIRRRLRCSLVIIICRGCSRGGLKTRGRGNTCSGKCRNIRLERRSTFSVHRLANFSHEIQELVICLHLFGFVLSLTISREMSVSTTDTTSYFERRIQSLLTIRTFMLLMAFLSTYCAIIVLSVRTVDDGKLSKLSYFVRILIVVHGYEQFRNHGLSLVHFLLIRTCVRELLLIFS